MLEVSPVVGGVVVGVLVGPSLVAGPVVPLLPLLEPWLSVTIRSSSEQPEVAQSSASEAIRVEFRRPKGKATILRIPRL